MRVSVLDQSGIVSEQPPDAAIRQSLEQARACERAGYYRYWVSEHHNSDGIAGSAPEVLLGALAAITMTIRIGSAGIMLPHYAPLKVAEQFRVLDALAPGRVDLGLGRGPGADLQATYALKARAMDNLLGMAGPDTFPQDVEDVVAWTRGEPLPDDHPYAGIRAQPLGATAPQPWILGSTPYTASVAGHLGLPYCFAHFFNDGAGAAEALEMYRTSFRPSSLLAAPLVSLCVWAVAGATTAAAEALFMPFARWRLARDSGRMVAFPNPVEMAGWSASSEEGTRIERLRSRVAHGTAEDVAAQLRSLAETHQADELVIVTMTHALADRIRSYELIAAGLGLASASHPFVTEAPR